MHTYKEIELAKQLAEAGLEWEPEEGDDFAVQVNGEYKLEKLFSVTAETSLQYSTPWAKRGPFSLEEPYLLHSIGTWKANNGQYHGKQDLTWLPTLEQSINKLLSLGSEVALTVFNEFSLSEAIDDRCGSVFIEGSTLLEAVYRLLLSRLDYYYHNWNEF